MPVSLLQADYLDVFQFTKGASSALSADARARIFGGSATALYQLG